MRTEDLTAWVEVDRGALAHNLRQVRAFVGPEVRVLAVVKADAYGHGAVEASRAFLAAGADFLGVTRLEEALELRAAGLDAPILVFSAALPGQAEAAVAHDLVQTVCTVESARALSAAAGAAGRTARVHVKVDSGMGRIGVPPPDLVAFLRELCALPSLAVEGIYTHFAAALAHKQDPMRRQLSWFLKATAEAVEAGLGDPLLHAANSAATLRYEASHLGMVRPGTILYGQYPGAHVPRRLELRETWLLKARVTFVKTVKRGDAIGYGPDFIAPRAMTVATLPLGYCDGLTLTPVRTARSMGELMGVVRDFARRGKMAVRLRGERAPFVGRVSMQMCCVDVSHIPGVQVGDEALVPARRTLTNPRLPRVYVGAAEEWVTCDA